MKSSILLTVGVILWSTWSGFSIEKTTVGLDNLVKVFEQNPANPQTTIQLLKELNKQGKSGQDVLDRYFKTQNEADYSKEYNWMIVRDYVNDIHAPQLKYVFENQAKFIQSFSKDDVYQKLDNVLVSYLEQFYEQDKANYDLQLKRVKEIGYEHYDVVSDYFNIRELRATKNAEDYFYKARKLFRYFPENRQMIKEITAGALEIMNDVSRLKVIQLWAGKTVESKIDFDAICNYVKISRKCGFNDVAKRYANIANNLASQSNSPLMKLQAGELLKMLN
ncbi:MAG: hypothetical protein RR137_04675 [Odoribacter sp.]